LFHSNYRVSGMGFLYLAANRQGTIVYNLPYIPPVIYRVIFQLAAALEFFEHQLADVRKQSLTLTTLVGGAQLVPLGLNSFLLVVHASKWCWWLRTESTRCTKQPYCSSSCSRSTILMVLLCEQTVLTFVIGSVCSPTYLRGHCHGSSRFVFSC